MLRWKNEKNRKIQDSNELNYSNGLIVKLCVYTFMSFCVSSCLDVLYVRLLFISCIERNRVNLHKKNQTRKYEKKHSSNYWADTQTFDNIRNQLSQSIWTSRWEKLAKRKNRYQMINYGYGIRCRIRRLWFIQFDLFCDFFLLGKGNGLINSSASPTACTNICDHRIFNRLLIFPFNESFQPQSVIRIYEANTHPSIALSYLIRQILLTKWPMEFVCRFPFLNECRRRQRTAWIPSPTHICLISDDHNPYDTVYSSFQSFHIIFCF